MGKRTKPGSKFWAPFALSLLSWGFWWGVWPGGSVDARAQTAAAPGPENRPGGAETAAQGVAVLSGGVGREAQDEMRRAAGAYNVHLLFATGQGAYLAGVSYSISDQQGKQLASGTSDGPWVYARLPPGRYQISAEMNGARQSREIQVPPSGAVRADFRFAD